ncbi:MAG: hypothetical protein KDB98_10555 [Flavobacteriales bacterium]|nr:hypothetical protein [Flavobacteriales bacterium]
MKYLGIWDFIWLPIYLLLIHYLAGRTQRKNEELNPSYKYYKRGFLAKVYGGLAFVFIYIFYYDGGDTIVYWQDAVGLNSLIFSEPSCYLRILLGDGDSKWYWCFDHRENLPFHYLRDPQAYAVARFSSLFALFSVDSLIGCTILVSWVSFGGVWRLYQVFCEEYPRMNKELAISFLFIPSVVFWGSGIMKDTFTFTAACWMTSSVYGLLLKRRDIFWNSVYVLFSSYVMISMKPYIFVALLPGVFIWVIFNRIQRIENQIIRVMTAPILLMVGLVGAAGVFSQASSSLGSYGSIDSIMETAVATQEDLKREAYKGNTFDIGTIDPSAMGMLSKAPVAIFASLFRPSLLDVKNPLMLISALENTVLMFFLLYMLFKIGPLAFIRYVASKPMILFSFSFAMIFSFAVGLTTSNFGSLVRYKIPALPFFLASLYMIRYSQELKRRGESDEDDQLEEVKVLTEKDFEKKRDPRPPFIPKPYGPAGEYK